MKRWFFVIVACAAMMGCSKKKEDEAKPAAKPVPAKPAAKKAEPAAKADPTPAAQGEVPPHAAWVSHKVKDYDKWKAAFDKHVEARKGAGALGHHVTRGADDANMIGVYVPLSDLAKFEAFSKGDDLKNAMKEAGVEGPPTIAVLKPVKVNVPNTKVGNGAIVVVHEVEDYDAWRKVYDEFDAKRQELGITGDAVNQFADNPNKIAVYHEADSVDTLKKFLESPELKEAMKNAGVKGKPEIHILTVADVATQY
jgi:hypothetical protein